LTRATLLARLSSLEAAVFAVSSSTPADVRARIGRDLGALAADVRAAGVLLTRLDALLLAALARMIVAPTARTDAEILEERWRAAWIESGRVTAEFLDMLAGLRDDFARDRASSTPPPPPSRPDTTAERGALAHALGLDLTAPADEIKRRVRALALEAHPDHGGAHERMVKLNRLRELIAGGNP
jgi:hypothetical protein